MKHLVKAQLYALTALFALSTAAFGATVTAVPAQLPKDAFANGGGGDDQQFFQTLLITLQDNGPDAWADGDDIVITLPDEITIPDMDEDGPPADWADEIFISVADGAASAGFTLASATASTITINVGTAANIVTGDALLVIFPIRTDADPPATVNYTITWFDVGTGLFDNPELTDLTAEVSFVDTMTLVDFNNTNWDAGLKQSSAKGEVYPDAADANVVVALPDFIVDQDVGVSQYTLEGSNDWGTIGVALDNDNTTTDEVVYTLWASMTSGMKRVAIGVGDLTHIPIHVSDGLPIDVAAENDLTFLDQTSGLVDTHLNGRLLKEGYWFFYVTSNLSADWALGSSDTVEIRHWPAFAADGTESGIDYDADAIFEPGVDDNLAEITLESGGIVARNGTVADNSNAGEENTDSVTVFWSFEDVDDPAEVHVFVSTSNNLVTADIQISGSPEQVDGLTGATKIHTAALFEEGGTNFVTWDIFTDATDFEVAGDYYIYIVANDGKTQVLEQVSDVTGPTQLTVHVKHFPWLDFHQVYDDGAGGGSVAFNTATDQIYVISWGETIEGDKDADAAGTATIDLYAVDILAAGGADWADVIGNLDGGITSAPVTFLQNNGVLLTSLTDDGDTQADNRYMWDLRAEGLAAADYHVYGTITHGDDQLTVQLNTDGDYNPAVGPQDDSPITVTHGTYLRAITPYDGPPVELDQADHFRLEWESFDQDGVSNLVKAVAVLEGTPNPGTASYTTWITFVSAEFIWLLSDASPDGTFGAVGVGADATLGSATITTSDYILDADGTALPGNVMPAGNYEVYYFFEADDTDFTGGTIPDAVKAPGMLYITGQTTAAHNIELSPSKASMAPGDILTVDILATDAGPDVQTVIFSVLVPQSSIFTLVDQDPDPDVFQPFDNLLGTDPGNALTGGEVLLNTSGPTADGGLLLAYMQQIPLPAGAVALSNKVMASFQLEMTGIIADPLEDIEITFGTDDPLVTNLFNADASPQATSLPPVALALKLGQSGKLTGVVDVEGRVDKDQEVSFFIVPVGSVEPITTASYLEANGDVDGSDGVQITLQGGGYYELNGIPTGEYNILVHKLRYTDSKRDNVRINSLGTRVENFTGARKLLGGDAAGYTNEAGDIVPNNRIDSEDTQAIADAGIGTTPSDPTWNTYADIDESGEVDVNDLFMAGKNIGTDGGGIFYKGIPGSNEEALVWLALADETAATRTYTVKAKNLASLGAYSARLTIFDSDWEIMDVTDGLSRFTTSVQASGKRGSDANYASAVLGYNAVSYESMDLMTITLRQLVSGAEEPSLAEVTLIDANGDLTKAIISTETAVSPKEFSLSQNYPNPFNPSTTISFSLPEPGNVELSVYNLLGQEVKTLVSSDMEPGTYKAVWNARNSSGQRVTSGIYFYRLAVNNKVIKTHKMVLLK